MALTIQERLKDLRVEWGLTLEQLANETGLSKSALGSYESEDYKDISHHAINRLADFYGVTADYLLARTETKRHPNAELSDLHLSDEMIELLKSKRVDTALLCELATHPDFTKLLADIQIYVEGIASMQIQNLNAWVDVARTEIMEKYQPEEQDKTMYLLQSAHVEEGDYFRSRVHKDMDGILEYIRKAHVGRSDGAPKTSVASFNSGAENVNRIRGYNRLEGYQQSPVSFRAVLHSISTRMMSGPICLMLHHGIIYS